MKDDLSVQAGDAVNSLGERKMLQVAETNNLQFAAERKKQAYLI